MSEQRVRSAIQLRKRDDVISRLGDICDGVVNRGHPRAYAKGFHAPLECGHALFKHGVGWVPYPGVDVALHLEIKKGRAMFRAVEFKRDGLVDGHSDSFRRRIA